MRSKRSLCGVSLSMVSLLALSVPGCKKFEELTGGGEEEAKSEEAKSEEAKEGEAKEGEAKEGEGDKAEDATQAEAAPVEPIPVEELHTGLDLILTMVPADAEFVIVRDATVVVDYMEEGIRFLDGPLAKLSSSPLGSDSDLAEAQSGFEEAKQAHDKLTAALASSKVALTEGLVFAETKGGKKVVVFNAPDPGDLMALGKALDESASSDFECKAIEGAEGFNVCTDDKKVLDGYALAEDPAALRDAMSTNLPGVDLEQANVIGHVDIGKSDESYFAMSTIPGQVYLAVNVPAEPDFKEMREALDPGEAHTLAHVQPGSGFIWGRVGADVMGKAMADVKGSPFEGAAKSMTGEFVLAGSVDPGGVIFQAGTTDTAGLEGLLAMAHGLAKEQVPKKIPELPDAEVVFESVPIEGGGKTANALHLGLTGVKEAEALKAYTGLHLDGWVFAANDVLTVAVGPDKENIGGLLDVTPGGPSSATLDSLPPQLAEGLGRNEVGMIIHMPVDFLHGAQMHSLARAAFKDSPEVSADDLIALAGLLAPLSSATVWATETGDTSVVHVAVQAIGNRATDEGKAALDAAHTVADGGDPAAAFSTLASTYGGSPMSWAYKTRAGTEGPGYMVGSGVGAVLATAAVAVPLMMGVSNENLADDLGVKPEDPEPELKPVTPVKRPTHTTKPKKDPKKDPKKNPDSGNNRKDPDSKDPVVEPPRPLPPTPTPDPSDSGGGNNKGRERKHDGHRGRRGQ